MADKTSGFSIANKNRVISLSSNTRWVAASQLARVIAQVIGVLVLTRLLPASDFGLIAMATVVTGFANRFRDLGTSSAVIHRQDVTQSLLSSVFWFNTLVGFIWTILLIALSPVFAYVFSEPKLEGALFYLSFSFLISGLGMLQQAILEKHHEFRKIAAIEIASAVLGLFVSIIAATHGAGVFSLVLQTLVSASTLTLGFWYISGWKPDQCSIDETKSFYRFSRHFLGFNILNYLARHSDDILVGRFLGSVALGYYSVGYKIMLLPIQNFTSVVTRAVYPKLCESQGDHLAMSQVYLRTIASIIFFTAPVMTGLFVLRDLLVELLLGKQWMPVANLIAWFAPVGMLQSVGAVLGTICLSIGRTDVMLRWSAIGSPVVVTAFILGINWGVEGVAKAYCIASILLFIPSIHVPAKLIGLKVKEVLSAIFPSIITSILMAIFVYIISTSALMNHSVNNFMNLIISATAGGAIYLLISIFLQRRLMLNLVKAIFA